MEKAICLCLSFLLLSGVTSQSVTITQDTVYVMNNVVGQVTCKLNVNCTAISWFLSRITASVASVFIGYSCPNATNGYYQTCDDKNHQYTLYFTGTTNLHGQTLRCNGENCTSQQNLSDTATIYIIVPVQSVSIKANSGQSITVTSGQSKSIACVTGASRPAPRILWYIGIINVTSLSTETQIPSRELIYTNSTLTFIPTKSQNGLQVNCKAYNTDNNIVELFTKPTLNVQYSPDNANAVIKQGNTLYTIEGNSTTLVCEVRGGNPLSIINWDCFGLTGTSATDGDISRSTINFIAHRSYNRRTCTCRATHPAVNLGNDSVTIYVYYTAKVTSMEISDGNNFTIPEHATKTITCLAEGLPKPTITLSYISNSSIIKSVNGLKLDFTFQLARCEDTGIYKCDAINKFTPQQPLQKNVFVLCQPRAAKEPLQNRYALSVGKTLNITVPYLAYPRPTFQWYKNDSNGSRIQITDSQDVQINNSAVNTYTFVIQFIRRNLKEDDFGTYILTSSNINGRKEDVYIVGAIGKPQKPKDGQAMCIDYRSAVITWKPGFFNGDNQTFSVVYKEKGGKEKISVSNISDPGYDKYINYTVNSLQSAKTYFFTIHSRNTLGESTPLEVNCSTKDVPASGASTGLAVGAGLGSAIVIIIIVVIVIFVGRRFKGGLTKGKRDVEMNGRKALTCDDDQEDEMRENILNEPAGSNIVKTGTSDEAEVGTSGGAADGQNDYPYAEIQKNGKSGLDNPNPVYAEVQKNLKKEKTYDPSAVYADVQKPKKEDKGAKPKKMNKKGRPEKKRQGDLYENVENVNKGNFAAAGPALVTKHNQTKPAKPLKAPKRNKDGLIYVDLDLEEPVTKPVQKLVIRRPEERTDYAEIDITKQVDPLPSDDKPTKEQKDSMP